MGNLSGFDAAKTERVDFSPMAPGSYRVAITDSQAKQTRAGTGTYIALTMTVLSGQYQNRKLFDNLNIRNQNQTAQSIAQTRLAEICEAVGVNNPDDSVELHNKPLVAVVGIAKRSDTGEPKNVVRQYRSVDDAEATETQKPDANKAPWENAPF